MTGAMGAPSRGISDVKHLARFFGHVTWRAGDFQIFSWHFKMANLAAVQKLCQRATPSRFFRSLGIDFGSVFCAFAVCSTCI